MDQFKIEQAKNGATNGRAFCLGFAAINLYSGYAHLAALMMLPIGAACLLDVMPSSRGRNIAALAVYAFAAGVGLYSLSKLW